MLLLIPSESTRRHEKRGTKNEIWFEYELDPAHVGTCRDNLAAMKKIFKTADKSMLLSAVMPGFHFFTRVRLRCGNKDEILRLGKRMISETKDDSLFRASK